MKYKIGDKVTLTDGNIMTIDQIDNISKWYRMKEDPWNCYIEEMIEGLVEEETKNWADISIPDGPYTVTYGSPSMNDSMNKNNIDNGIIILPEGYIFKDENGNVINATKIVLEKEKEEDKGTKVRHKTKGMVETVVGLCKIKYMGAWVDGVIYEGNDTVTGKPMTFVRLKEDFENNFELC